MSATQASTDYSIGGDDDLKAEFDGEFDRTDGTSEHSSTYSSLYCGGLSQSTPCCGGGSAQVCPE